MDWNRFQLLMLAVAASMLAIRALALRLNTRVNVFKIGHPSELGFVLAESVVVLLIFRQAQLVTIPLPALADRLILRSEMAHRAGGVFVVAGVLIFALALLSFGNSWRIGIDRRTPGALVTTGLFRLSRNPIFVFLDLYLAGAFLINGTLAFLLAAVVGAAFLHFQILREERFLHERYGEPYRNYCANTPRYFLL